MIGIVDYLSSYWMEGMLAKGRVGHELVLWLWDWEVIVMINVNSWESSSLKLKICAILIYAS